MTRFEHVLRKQEKHEANVAHWTAIQFVLECCEETKWEVESLVDIAGVGKIDEISHESCCCCCYDCDESLEEARRLACDFEATATHESLSAFIVENSRATWLHCLSAGRTKQRQMIREMSFFRLKIERRCCHSKPWWEIIGNLSALIIEQREKISDHMQEKSG